MRQNLLQLIVVVGFTSLSLLLFLQLRAEADNLRPRKVHASDDLHPNHSHHLLSSISQDHSLSRLQKAWITTFKLNASQVQHVTMITAAVPTTQKKVVMLEKDVINPHHFTYLLNPKNICHTSDGSHVKLLVYVHSAPANLYKRQSIRQTWGEKSLLQHYNATLVFIMGTLQDTKLLHLLQMESDLHGDIVQEDFADSYRNLTYKAIAGLKWAATYCSQATYILKTDDDILVNIYRVVEHLHKVVQPQYGTRRLILCNQWLRMKIIREQKSKWYIPEQDFSGDYFPPYCSGSAFILSGDMAQLMYDASLLTPFFWVDDYYITGALIQHLDIKHRRLNQAYSFNPYEAEGNFRNDRRRELFFFHLQNLRVLYGLWHNMTLIDAPPTARAMILTNFNSVHSIARAA